MTVGQFRFGFKPLLFEYNICFAGGGRVFVISSAWKLQYSSHEEDL